MYLKIVNGCFSEHVFKEIEALTNYGILFFKKIEFSADKKTILIPISRCKIKEIKKIFFGTTIHHKYDKTFKIPSQIVVRNIIDYKVENNFDDPNISEAHMLFGVHVDMKNREVYIGSAEEYQGKMCYSIELNVSEIDFEIKDVLEKPGTHPQ